MRDTRLLGLDFHCCARRLLGAKKTRKTKNKGDSMSEIWAFYTQGAFVEELFSSWSGGVVAAGLIVGWILPLIANVVFAMIFPRAVGYGYTRYGVLSWLIRVGGWILAAVISLGILGVGLYCYIAHFEGMSRFGAVMWAILVMFAPALVFWVFKLLMRLVRGF